MPIAFTGSRGMFPVNFQEGVGPVDPRGRPLRSGIVSLVFLMWHVLGFWWGYLRRVRPLLVKNHAVIGDRYAYDIFLDPRRFRLRLPDFVCRWAALVVSPAGCCGGFTC